MPIVLLPDGGVQRFVTQVKDSALMARPKADRSRVATLDELPQDIGGLLPVGDAGERAVLAFDKDAAVDQDLDEKER